LEYANAKGYVKDD